MPHGEKSAGHAAGRTGQPGHDMEQTSPERKGRRGKADGQGKDGERGETDARGKAAPFFASI